jgi:hypothetical protein
MFTDKKIKTPYIEWEKACTIHTQQVYLPGNQFFFLNDMYAHMYLNTWTEKEEGEERVMIQNKEIGITSLPEKSFQKEKISTEDLELH